MSAFQYIKQFFFNQVLKEVLPKKPLQRDLINLRDAKSIGILFIGTKPDDIITISNFADSLKSEQKQVFILGYQDLKNKEEIGPRLFNKNSVNWYGIPQDAKVDQFQTLNLDILICAFNEECMPLEYIAATSKAKFRIGVYNPQKVNFYELMLNVSNEKPLPYVLQQIVHFLKAINKHD